MLVQFSALYASIYISIFDGIDVGNHWHWTCSKMMANLLIFDGALILFHINTNIYFLNITIPLKRKILNSSFCSYFRFHL